MARDSLKVSSIDKAWGDFMAAPATGGYGNNASVIDSNWGSWKTPRTGGELDSIRDHYGAKKGRRGGFRIKNLRDAFSAAWRGSKDWRHFDLERFRELIPEFRNLQLPARVEAALERDAIAGEEQHAIGEMYHGYEPGEHHGPAHVPIEILHREGPRSRRRTVRGRKLSRNARGRDELARAYRKAKRAYHAAGEQLRWSGIKGDLL